MRKILFSLIATIAAIIAVVVISINDSPNHVPVALALTSGDEAVNLKATFATEKATLTWEANPDELLLGWRIVKEEGSGPWETVAELRDPTVRKYTLTLPPGPVTFHVWSVLKANVKEVAGTVPGTVTPPVEEPPKEEPPKESGPIRAFNSGSPFNTPIPVNPVLDSNSAKMVEQWGSNSASANMHEFGTPVFETKAGDPVFNVKPRESWSGRYEGPIPIPASAHPSPGSDHSMIIIDRASGWAYDFWEAEHVGSEWRSAYDSRFEFQGSGTPGHGASGAGMPLLATLTRAFEIKQGHIDHAVSLALRFTASSWVYPAFKSDGHNTYPPGFPEGTRLQLDPTVNCATLNAVPAEVTICHALQTYGAYVKNTTGSTAGITVGFEDAGSVTAGNPFFDAGLTSDYFSLKHIPWNKLRVLHSWNGS